MKLVHILLDETGSMMSMKAEAIEGVNAYLDKIGSVDEDEDVRVSLTKFDTTGYRTLMDEVPVSEAIRLDDDNYTPGVGTNLLDAIGYACGLTTKSQKKLLKSFDQVPTLVLIVTDGGENASTEWTRDSVNELIKEKEGDGWTFMYIGASADAWANETIFAGTVGASNMLRSTGAKGYMMATANAGSSYDSWSTQADTAILNNVTLTANIVDEDQKEETLANSN
jgi:hypothetical protein